MKLCDYVSVSTGKSNTQDSVLDGKYPFFDRSINIKRSQKYLFDCEAIIIPGEGSSFIPRYYNGKFDLHQRCYCVYNFKNIIGKYLFYQLFYKKEYLSRVATGSTVHSLRIYNILEMPVSVCDVITQQHIVNTILILLSKFL